MFKHKFLNTLISILMITSLLLGGAAPVYARAQDTQVLPAQNAAPANPTDQTKVPHYFGPYPNWANSPQVLANAIVTISPVAPVPGSIGNSLTADRANPTDTTANVFVVNTATPLVAGSLTNFQTWAQVGSGTNTFDAYVLRPTGIPNEYTVVFDSGPLTVLNTASGLQTFTLTTPFTVQAGDLIAHFGQGIPFDSTGGSDTTMSPVSLAPVLNDVFTINDANHPVVDTVHIYSIAATVLPVVPGAGAEATATVSPLTGGISAVTVINPGSGYTSAPNVAITAPGMSLTDPAVATAVISNGSISSITVDAPGFGFTTPVVNFTGGSPTTVATAVASGGVDNLIVTDGGLGYDANAFPVFSLPNLPGGIQATGTLVLDANGVITGITVTNPGTGYTSAPTVSINEPTTGLPTTAVVTMPTATINIGKIDVTLGGAGYTSIPTVTITDGLGGPDLGASATAIGSVFGAVTAINVTHAGAGYLTPGLRKFVDTLPGLGPGGVNDLGQYIPVAVPDQTTYPGTDYYEIGVVQYRMKFHQDLPASLLRGYVQLSTSVIPGAHVALSNANFGAGSTPILLNRNQVYGVDNPHYLGPTIVATKNRPVRILFRNLLPTGVDGNLFLPVDTTFMGSGAGPNMMMLDANNVPMDMAPDNKSVIDGVRNPMCGEPGLKDPNCYSDNRATLHLHGGITPWISDGTPHQWTTPAGEGTSYPKGVSVSNVPDMPDPGPGALTFFYTNQQSARLLFYHDHAWGITRLNVYAGEAAGYVITDDTENKLFGAGKPFGDLGLGTPLIIQDKTFVSSKIAQQDPTWDASRWGGEGSLWYEHVYMPAENPADPSGMSPFGRWFYGPYFWPPATDAKYQPIPNPYYNMDPATNFTTSLATPCDLNDSATWQYKTYPFCEPPTIPSTPNNSAGMEQFNDTPLVNGTAYPTTTVDPKAYRFRILNAANDRFWNLQWYVADPTTGTLSEVAFNPAELAAAQTDPNVFPTPDTTKSPAGPNWIQIGTEGGFLPAPVVIPAQPMTWITDPTRFDWGNGDKHSLLLAPAERADVIVDFSQFRGKTLILYNDAAAAYPGRIATYDYYTGGPDLTGIGGAPSTLPGYGPNTRTIMQVKVTNVAPAVAFDRPNTSADRLGTLQAAFAHHTDGSGVFESGQNPIIVGQAAYNGSYGTNFASSAWCNSPTNPTTKCDGFARIQEQGFPPLPDGSPDPNAFKFKFDTLSGTQLAIPLQPKALHDETNAANFDPWGRMSANLGLEAPGASPLTQNIILYPYVNPATENLDATGLPSSLHVTPISSSTDGTQIWKITHNGVDTHPIHFHLYDVQILNRVTWDNIIMPPEPNELGWKDTIRVSPLQDTIVALRPIVPTLPFGLPDSKRLLNPAMPEHAIGDPNSANGYEAGFNNVDALGNPMTPLISNEITDFGWEYVWHCHILSHEEMDMMRPQVVHVARDYADAPVLGVTGSSGSAVNLSWTDGTPVVYANPLTFTSSWGNPKSEIGYRIERSVDAGVTFNPLGTAIANATSFTDNTTVAGTAYQYRVVAFNAAGDSQSNVVAVAPPIILGAGKYDDADPAFTYIGSWLTLSGTGPYANTLHYSMTIGNDTQVAFTGRQFELTYLSSPDMGIVDVYVDGIKVASINQYSAIGTWQTVWNSDLYPAGTHSVRFVHASGTFTSIDAITVIAAPVILTSGTHDDANAAWNYTNNWLTLSGTGPYANTLHYSMTIGEDAQVAFTGRQFKLTYLSSPDMGIVDVYVDGLKVASINQYSAIGTWQTVWYSDLYPSGDHSVRFVHASGTFTAIDAITVIATPVILTSGPHDDANAAWNYTNNWLTLAGTGPYANTLHYSMTIGEGAQVAFTGQQFELTYLSSPDMGIVDVYVDGLKVASINQYSAIGTWQVIWTSNLYPAGDHSVRFVHASGAFTSIDAITVIP